ncbi:TraR/DksA C4-type zinc finger protein [Oligoflexia bacterium]|nr:TraR/DksA C4-type zinc finger protein [Oligoflexia bacterium]
MEEELSEDQKAELRETLRKLEAEIEAYLASSADSAKPVELDQQLMGRLSRMDAIQQQEMHKANRRNYQARLLRVKYALNQDNDEYGVCTRCGEDIGYKRLTVQPESTSCIQCQTEAEGRRS